MVHTGFGYEFDSLQFKQDELSIAFASLFANGARSTIPSGWTIKPILMKFAPMILKLVRTPSFFFLEEFADTIRRFSPCPLVV